MIDTAEAIHQIQRLAQLRGYPKGDEGAAAREDLVEQIQQAKDLPQAKEIIRDFLDNATAESQCPMMSEIRTAVLSRLDAMRTDPDCKLCGGDGWPLVVRNGVESRGPKCSCWARRPEPVYTRQPMGKLTEDIAKLAEAKRGN